MILNNATQSFVLDYRDITNYLYQYILKFKTKGSRELLRDAEDLVYRMVDQYITEQLLWSNQDGDRRMSYRRFIREYPQLFDQVDDPGRILDTLSDRLADHILAHIDLPTWSVLHLTKGANSVLVEVDGDYRIMEWEREHGHKYGIRHS